MPLTLKGSQIAATTSVTLPSHNIGDLIVIIAGRQGNATAPSVPSAAGTVPAWTTIDALSGATAGSLVTAYFVATATNHTSGTWTNATGMIASVVSGQAASPIGGHAATNPTGSTSSDASPSITMTNTDGSSLLLYIFGHNSPLTSWGAAPTGYTQQQATGGSFLCLDTKNTTTSDGSSTQTLTASSAGNAAAVVEILAQPNGDFFRFF